MLEIIVGWCNGSTKVFGSFSFGSSPGPITKMGISVVRYRASFGS